MMISDIGLFFWATL